MALVLLEAGLQTASAVLKSVKLLQTKKALKHKNGITILCLGESTTGDQYPKFLKQALLDAGVKKDVNIIDKGAVATDTETILENMPAYIEQFKPDIIVAMMGINDGENYTPQASAPKLKTLKLFYLISRHLAAPVAGVADTSADNNTRLEILQAGKLAEKFYAEKNYKAIDNLFLQVTEKYPDYLVYIAQNRDFLLHLPEKKRFEIIETALARGMDVESLTVLEYAMQTKNEKLLTETLHRNPRDLRTFVYQIKKDFPKIYAEFESGEFKTSDIGEISADLGFKALNSFVEGDFATADATFNRHTEFLLNNIAPQTEKNYLRLARLCRQNDIKLVAMQYPVRSVKPLKAMLESANEVIFVSNENNFKNALKQYPAEEIFKDQFGGDFGHCTDFGNKLIAKNLAETLAKIISY